MHTPAPRPATFQVPGSARAAARRGPAATTATTALAVTAFVATALAATSGCAPARTVSRADLDDVQSQLQARDAAAPTLPAPPPATADADADADADDGGPPPDEDPAVAALLDAPLTVDGALRLALLHNAALRAELRDLGVSRGAMLAAGALPDPELSAGVRAPLGGDAHTTWELGVGIDLTRLLLAGTRSDAARAAHDASRLAAADAVRSLAINVRLAYIDVQAAEENLVLTTRVFEGAETRLITARALHDAGNIPTLTLLHEQAALETTRLEVAEAASARLAARERLAALLGIDAAASDWRITAALEPSPLPEGEAATFEPRAVEASLALAATRRNVAALRDRAGLARTERVVPGLSVAVHAEHDAEGWTAGPSLGVSLPLSGAKGGAALAATAEADAAADRARAAERALRGAVRLTLEEAQASDARERHHRETLVPLRREILRESVLHYNAMELSVFELLQAHHALLGAERMHLEALRDLARARARLLHLVAGGAPPGESPSAPAAPRPDTASSAPRGH